ARNRQAMLAHLSGNLPRPAEARGHPDPHRLTAEQKVFDAKSLQEALSWLGPAERVHVAGDPRLLERLAELPDSLLVIRSKHSALTARESRITNHERCAELSPASAASRVNGDGHPYAGARCVLRARRNSVSRLGTGGANGRRRDRRRDSRAPSPAPG